MGGSKPGERRGGRKKGTPNKFTAAVKDMILQALMDEGGVAYLRKLARENQASFSTLVGKLVPIDMNAKVDGEIGMRPIVLGTAPPPEEC